MEHCVIDEVSVLLLQNSGNGEERRGLSATETLIEILTEQACDNGRVSIQFQEGRWPALCQEKRSMCRDEEDTTVAFSLEAFRPGSWSKDPVVEEDLGLFIAPRT